MAGRAALFALLSAWLPFPVFLFAAFLLYVIPFFRPFQFFFPFGLLLALAWYLPHGPLTALFLGLGFFLLIGTRDLILIDRRSAYHSFILILLFTLSAAYAWRFPHFGSPERVWYALLFSFAFALLLRGFLRTVRVIHEVEERRMNSEEALTLVLAGFIFFELLWVVPFLPLAPIFQAAFLFLAAVLLIEFGVGSMERTLTRHAVLANASLFIVCASIILTLNEWRL